METDEPSLSVADAQIAGLESQVLNSQGIILRLNGELDNASLRISTLENVCSENQIDLHCGGCLLDILCVHGCAG